MAKPITKPWTFQGQTGPIPLSELDQDFDTAYAAVNDANTYSNYFADTGVANAYAINTGTITFTLGAGLAFFVKIANANSTASTLSVNGGPLTPIVTQNGTALVGGEFVANRVYFLVNDGTSFQIAGVYAAFSDFARLSTNNTFLQNANAFNVQIVRNTNAGASAGAVIDLQNDASPIHALAMAISSTGGTVSSLITGGPASEGVWIGSNVAIPVSFITNLIERIRMDGAGAITINGASAGNSLSVAKGAGTFAIIASATSTNSASVSVAGDGGVPGTTSLDLVHSPASALITTRSALQLILGVNSVSVITISSGKNVSIAAPPSGTTLALASPGGTGVAITTDGNDLTAFAGTFTATLTGYAANPTGTVNYVQIGRLVHMWITAGISGTSNATALTMTGLPARITPANPHFCRCTSITNNGADFLGGASVANTGIISFTLDLVSGTNIVASSTAFTAAGTKGLQTAWSITYGI